MNMPNLYTISLICTLCCFSCTKSYQEISDYNNQYIVSGTYKTQAAQGMAVYGNYAYLLNNSGLCRVYDLKRQETTDTFSLASADKNNHANCASFGCETKDDNPLPVIYISECNKPYRCFVESISNGKSTLEQTIIPQIAGNNGIIHDWIVDNKEKCIYSVGRLKIINDSTGERLHHIAKYRLPLLEEGQTVFFNESDVIDYFDVVFPNLLQGGIIDGHYLYLPVGLREAKEKRKDGDRAIIVIDVKAKQISKIIDISNICLNEPEDCDIYKGKLLIYYGQTGGLYEINK